MWRGGWCNLGKGGVRSQKDMDPRKGEEGPGLRNSVSQQDVGLWSGQGQGDFEVSSLKML